MIKEKLKKLGCFVLAASMLLCNQMPVFADNLLGYITIKSDQTVNLQECNNVNLKLTVSIGSKDVTFTNGDRFEAAAGSDNAKALGAIKYYTDNAANDSDFVNHFSVDSTKSSENNAVIFKLLANESDSISPLDMSTVTSGSNYYLGGGTNLNNFEKSFYIKKTGSTYRFYFGSAAVLNSFLVKDKAYYVDENSNVQPVSQYTDTFDFNDISAEITEDSPYPNVSMKFVSTMPSSYDMSGLKYDVVFRASGDKVVFAFPSVTYVEDIKNSLIDVNDYDLTYYSDTDVTPTETSSLKAGSILKKNVSYLISNFNTGSEVTSTNKKYNRDNIAFYDADTNGCLETTGKKLSSGTPVASAFTPKKTYKAVSVKREMLGDFDYCYTVMLKHEHVETTATNKVADPTCTAKGVNELITTCSDCGDEVRHEIQYVNALGHNAGTPTKEDVIPSTCTEGGSYQEITRCTRCNEILKSELKTTPALGHNFGAWTKVDNVTADVIDNALNKALFDGQAAPASLEKRTCATCGGYELIPDEIHEHSNYVTTNENVVDATCSSEGGYDVVTRCGTCNEEISRTHIVTEKIAHTPAKSVVENEVKATCTADGSYDEVVKCSVCGEELSRTARTTKALGHVNGTVVKENVVNPSCETEGGYDEVIYCERDEDGCNHSKLSSTHVTVPATGHLHQATRIEKTKEPSCTKNGLYKSVTYCTDCNKVLDSKDIVIPATGHTAGEMTIENNVDPTCTAGGSYDEVVRCTTCNDVISRNTVKVAALGHAAGEPVIENMVKPTEKKEGSYDVVVYCTRDEDGCNHSEISRKHVVLDKLEHKHTAGAPVIKHVTEPTCTSSGTYYANIYCTECGELLDYTVINLPGLGHMYPQDEWIKVGSEYITKDFFDKAKNAKELEKKTPFESIDKEHDSVYTVKCYRCDSYVVKVVKHVHTAGAPVIKHVTEPTCTSGGTYYANVYCTDCGELLDYTVISLPGLGHMYPQDQWIKVGSEYITKDFFDKAENAKELEKKTPFESIDKEYDSVYTVKCYRCDSYVVKVAKHVHTAGAPVMSETKKATCTEKGIITSTTSCTGCGKALESTIMETPALGHVAGEPVIENKVDPTTEKEGGYDIVVYCTRDEDGCGHKELSRKHVVINKLKHEHTVGEPVIEVVKAATCEDKGSVKVTVSCADCGKVLSSVTKDIPALGHNYELTKTVDATCTEDGYVLYTCKNDAEHTEKTVIKATGHEYSDPVVENKNDLKHDEVIYCAKCGEELSRKTVIDAQPETKPDAVLPETKPEEAAPAETVETPVETVVETPATEQASETDTETAAPVTNDTSDTMTYVYVMLLGAAAVCATAVLRRKKTDIEE